MADIQTLDDDEITDKFNEYSAALSSAIANMPLVEQARMDQYRKKSKNADGSSEWETTFPNISDIARWNECGKHTIHERARYVLPDIE